jgi:hypothetical protein
VRETARPPRLRLWFETGTRDETDDRDGNGVIDAIQDTTELVDALTALGYAAGLDVVYVQVEGASTTKPPADIRPGSHLGVCRRRPPCDQSPKPDCQLPVRGQCILCRSGYRQITSAEDQYEQYSRHRPCGCACLGRSPDWQSSF